MICRHAGQIDFLQKSGFVFQFHRPPFSATPQILQIEALIFFVLLRWLNFLSKYSCPNLKMCLGVNDEMNDPLRITVPSLSVRVLRVVGIYWVSIKNLQ